MGGQKLNPGGHILIDNMLWSGKVLNKPDIKDKETNEIMKLNKKIIKLRKLLI